VGGPASRPPAWVKPLTGTRGAEPIGLSTRFKVRPLVIVSALIACTLGAEFPWWNHRMRDLLLEAALERYERASWHY
jgi:hypothetical protein